MKPTSSKLLISIILVIGIAVAVYFAFKHELLKIDTFESERLKVMLFHASWCPHCVSYLKSGVWEKFKVKIMSDKSLSGVIAMDYEYEAYKEVADKYKIDRFPYIIAEDNTGKVTVFNGNRNSVDELYAFVKSLV